MERLTHHERDFVGRHDEFVVLGDTARDSNGVTFLEGVGADRSGRHLTRDADHRNGVHVGVAQRRDHVGSRWPRRHHGHTRASGHVGVPLGHVPSTLFVAHENVTDRAAEQRVVRRQDASAGQTKDGVDLLFFQSSDEGLGSSDLLAHVGSCGCGVLE